MITILTPTYNRAYVLVKVYESLCRQSEKNFEWLIVDDGSKDNTEEVVQKWIIKQKDFLIRYHKQENGGKHRAVNTGVKIANGDYIFVLDSDDIITDDAVECMYKWLKTIEGKDNYSGVAGLRKWPDGTIIGKSPQNVEFVDALFSERRKYNLSGDKAEVFRKEVLLKYPYPEFEGERFLQEAAAWDKMSIDGLKMRWFAKPIAVSDYLEDGLTMNLDNDKFAKNFQGFTYCTKLYLQAYPFPFPSFKIGHYSVVAKKNKMKDSEICRELGINVIQLWFGRGVYGMKRIKSFLFGPYLKNNGPMSRNIKK